MFVDNEVSKAEFSESKKGIKLKDVHVDKIVISNTIKGNNEIVKCYIGYLDENVIPFCLILPQMSGWIKYFQNGGKNMSLKIDEDWVYLKYNEIWNNIKELLGRIKLINDVFYDDQYIKTKVKIFSEVIKTLFDRDKIPEEKVGYTCLSCISIDSVLKIDKKWFPQVYLERCKYKVIGRKIKSLKD